MNTSPLLLAAACLFWGWQTGQWLIALCVAAALELPRVIPRRWPLALRDFNRMADFCSIVVFALFVYFYFAYGNPRAMVLLFQWLPVALAPLALAQAWSDTPQIPLSVVFRSQRKNPPRREINLNLGYPYFALWLLGAGAANRAGSGFFLGVAALCAWPLFLQRSRAFHPGIWLCAFVATGLIGLGIHTGLFRLQQSLEGLAVGGTRTDPYRSMTDIGEIGELKLSENIVLRVESDRLRAPILLHRASYDEYARGAWIARNRAFHAVPRAVAIGDWILADGSPAYTVTVHDSAHDGNPVLALPTGTVRVEGLQAIELKQNALGTVQAEHPPGYLRYLARIEPDVAAEEKPSAQDLSVPAAEAGAIQEAADKLQLKTMAPAQALQSIRSFFSSQFSYALYQRGTTSRRTALAEFLQSSRAGHCEYFATATVLLARTAGIPARYATGFSAMEYSPFERLYLVRERHAHAWARVYVGGRWMDLDTTPPSWSDIEAQRQSAWSHLSDVWSFGRFTLARWAQADKRFLIQAAVWAAGLACLWLAWSLLRRKSPAKPGALRSVAEASSSGVDSEFYRVLDRMGELGWQRSRSESIVEWLSRTAAQPQFDPQALEDLARLHYRYRFDPVGLDAQARTALREGALGWLARHPPP